MRSRGTRERERERATIRQRLAHGVEEKKKKRKKKKGKTERETRFPHHSLIILVSRPACGELLLSIISEIRVVLWVNSVLNVRLDERMAG